LKIISTNIGRPKVITWNNKQEQTGIFKEPTNAPIYLGKDDVKDDEVSDRKHHGGTYKACYLFSAEQYPYWKNLYPNLNWKYGMFGENLTISNLDETKLIIGSIYKVGNAKIEITQPREPCYKFGLKFGNQEVLKQFIEHGYPGTYVRVLKEGTVKSGDIFSVIHTPENKLTTFDFFKLLYSKDKDQELLKLVLKSEAIPIKKRQKLSVFLK